jgi:hypothetical protein
LSGAVHLNLDDAWPTDVLGLPSVDARAAGPRLRCLARPGDVEEFYQSTVAALPPFVLYGSGDFHHLTALLLRRIGEPVHVIVFDNHPDWDVRPPRWSCGGWVNRALDLRHVTRVDVWGCGNFELAMPSRLFANRRALRAGRLRVVPWAERLNERTRRRYDCVTCGDWRERFEAFAAQLDGNAVYVTVDLDCVTGDEAVTNWEGGLFTAADVAWAIDQLRAHTRVVGGDVCGAYSPPRFERRLQKLADWWDHPKTNHMNLADPRRLNLHAIESIWPSLTARHQHNANRDQADPDPRRRGDAFAKEQPRGEHQ